MFTALYRKRLIRKGCRSTLDGPPLLRRFAAPYPEVSDCRSGKRISTGALKRNGACCLDRIEVPPSRWINPSRSCTYSAIKHKAPQGRSDSSKRQSAAIGPSVWTPQPTLAAWGRPYQKGGPATSNVFRHPGLLEGVTGPARTSRGVLTGRIPCPSTNCVQ